MALLNETNYLVTIISPPTVGVTSFLSALPLSNSLLKVSL